MEYNFKELADRVYQIEFNKSENEVDTIEMWCGVMDQAVTHWEDDEEGGYIGYERETTIEELAKLKEIFNERRSMMVSVYEFKEEKYVHLGELIKYLSDIGESRLIKDIIDHDMKCENNPLDLELSYALSDLYRNKFIIEKERDTYVKKEMFGKVMEMTTDVLDAQEYERYEDTLKAIENVHTAKIVTALRKLSPLIEKIMKEMGETQ